MSSSSYMPAMNTMPLPAFFALEWMLCNKPLEFAGRVPLVH